MPRKLTTAWDPARLVLNTDDTVAEVLNASNIKDIHLIRMSFDGCRREHFGYLKHSLADCGLFTLLVSWHSPHKITFSQAIHAQSLSVSWHYRSVKKRGG